MDFLNNQSCPTPVMPGATCTLQFVFAPLAVGARSAYLTVSNTSANPMISVLMTGVGLEANAGPAYLNPASLAFTASGSPMSATLSNNSSTLALTIDAISISNDPTSGQAAFTETNNCGTSLAPQATCMIAVTALATAQPYSTGVLTVGDDANGGPQTLPLSYSNGFSGPIKFDFGSRSLGTQGTGPLDFTPPGYPGLYNLTLTGPNATDFSFQSGSSSQTSSCLTSRIFPYCSPVIYFTPSALGLRTATLNLNGVPYGGVIGVGLTTGMHFSLVDEFGGRLSPSSIDFRVVAIGASPATVVGIVNTGTVPLTLNAPVLSGSNPSDFAVVSKCTTLAPNGTCSLSVTASPTQPINRFATLSLTDSTATVQQTVSLKVLGINPPPVANPLNLTFSYTPFGSVSASQSFTVTSFNNDPVSVQILDEQFLPFFLTQGNSCSVTPCQISVAFAPTAANTASGAGGNSFGDILVTDLFSGLGAVVNTMGTWLPPPPPPTTMVISPSGLSFSPQSVGTTSMSQSLLLTNTGGQPLVFNQISLGGPHPEDYVLTNSCPGTVAVGGNCSLTVAFSPTATGSLSASVQVTSNANIFPYHVPLTGLGQ